MCPPNANSGDRDDDLCILECLNGGNKRRRKKMAIVVDWEDFIIETLLLHREELEEIEKGHYSTLLDLHVFNSGSVLNSYSVLRFTISHIIYPPDAANVSQIKIVSVF
ncbi:Plant-specific TFIIB-related protein PTF2 [Camellia lanceoleosa]|uniref:Plant-specific TFIIB-related protein PTF2 n=1 Tax=Camellia lanceoleosa TaxID=1840588 RepID=A0ACC0H293_9ERIC|nr:Plant-specific TFIIB-related protein PTF2 [Camellia lanceoleosa]